MNEFDLQGPRIEKRVLPLLDVALTLVGMLILLVSVANSGNPDDGMLRVRIDRLGVFRFGDAVIAEKNEIFEEELLKLESQASQSKEPLITIEYPAASTKQLDVLNLVQIFQSWCEERGIKWRLKSYAEE